MTIAFLTCAGALGSSIFLISDMDSPCDGVIMISSHAMRVALAPITG
ncbi:MAG: hypothetical protein J0H99_17985 [Rhodospirillales bacterium]|nr:hypothetical protein [Rhodospirillales bacterium]